MSSKHKLYYVFWILKLKKDFLTWHFVLWTIFRKGFNINAEQDKEDICLIEFCNGSLSSLFLLSSSSFCTFFSLFPYLSAGKFEFASLSILEIF